MGNFFFPCGMRRGRVLLHTWTDAGSAGETGGTVWRLLRNESRGMDANIAPNFETVIVARTPLPPPTPQYSVVLRLTDFYFRTAGLAGYLFYGGMDSVGFATPLRQISGCSTDFKVQGRDKKKGIRCFSY